MPAEAIVQILPHQVAQNLGLPNLRFSPLPTAIRLRHLLLLRRDLRRQAELKFIGNRGGCGFGFNAVESPQHLASGPQGLETSPDCLYV